MIGTSSRVRWVALLALSDGVWQTAAVDSDSSNSQHFVTSVASYSS